MTRWITLAAVLVLSGCAAAFAPLVAVETVVLEVPPAALMMMMP